MLNALTTKAYIKATEAFRSFKNNEEGVTAIEYGLIAVAVALMIVAVFYNDQGFLTQIKTKFATLTAAVKDAN